MKMDNKRVSNKQILDKINDLKVGEEGLNILALKIVSRMVKLKSMEDWFEHVSKSEPAFHAAYKDLDLTEEEKEAIKNMTAVRPTRNPRLGKEFLYHFLLLFDRENWVTSTWLSILERYFH